MESLKERGPVTVLETRRGDSLKSGDQRKRFCRGCFHPRIPAAEGLAQIAIHHLHANLQ